MRNKVFGFIAVIFLFFCLAFTLPGVKAGATTLEPATEEDDSEIVVGQDENGNTTVTYYKYTFIRKYNGWYVPAAYIYNGSDLDIFLDSVIEGTARTSVRCDGFLFIKMSGGWYRHELHVNDGRILAAKFNEAAGITSTYNPNLNLKTPDDVDVQN